MTNDGFSVQISIKTVTSKPDSTIVRLVHSATKKNENKKGPIEFYVFWRDCVRHVNILIDYGRFGTRGTSTNQCSKITLLTLPLVFVLFWLEFIPHSWCFYSWYLVLIAISWYAKLGVVFNQKNVWLKGDDSLICKSVETFKDAI